MMIIPSGWALQLQQWSGKETAITEGIDRRTGSRYFTEYGVNLYQLRTTFVSNQWINTNSLQVLTAVYFLLQF